MQASTHELSAVAAANESYDDAGTHGNGSIFEFEDESDEEAVTFQNEVTDAAAVTTAWENEDNSDVEAAGASMIKNFNSKVLFL